jgi:hypothetical protein
MATGNTPSLGTWVPERTLRLFEELLAVVERTATLVEEQLGVTVEPRREHLTVVPKEDDHV